MPSILWMLSLSQRLSVVFNGLNKVFFNLNFLSWVRAHGHLHNEGCFRSVCNLSSIFFLSFLHGDCFILFLRFIDWLVYTKKDNFRSSSSHALEFSTLPLCKDSSLQGLQNSMQRLLSLSMELMHIHQLFKFPVLYKVYTNLIHVSKDQHSDPQSLLFCTK